jgi:hypothetical protein
MRTYLKGNFKRHTGLMIVLISILNGCKKLVEVEAPVTSISLESVFNSDDNAISALTSLYKTLGNTVSIYNSSINLGFSADEYRLVNGSGSNIAYYQNSLSSNKTITTGADIWNGLYPIIYKANLAIENLNISTGLSLSIRQQLLGEAKFTRAFCYFYLTNLYGALPIVISSDYNANRLLSRSPQADVYAQIKTDLTEAQSLLTEKYIDGTLKALSPERVRPTKWAATALLARVYLYNKEWTNAENQSTVLINNTSLFSLSSFPNSFLRAGLGNNEAIFQLQPTGGLVRDATSFILTAPPTANKLVLSDTLLNSFEAGDLREVNWVGSLVRSGVTYYFPSKYKIRTSANSLSAINEYVMIFRLAEQYLIRAEARAQLNNLLGSNSAANDLNVIRNRAGLPPTTAATQVQMLTAIMHERQIEFFSELGHRWLDLKRTGLTNTVMSGITSLKGGTWADYKQLYPIPYNDILNDPNLSQNPGY